MFMRNKIIYILILNVLLSFPDCEHGNPNWEQSYESVPFDNEFNATISAVQIFIDGVEQTGGKLAAFGEDGIISALDSDGSTFFPPGENYVYELSVWSNQVTGEIMTFKYYDEDNDFVIDLNQTYIFTSNDIVGDGFSPYELTGLTTDCDFQGSNHFSDVVDTTGVSQLIILSNSISNLDVGDQIGIFDYNGLLSEGEECEDLLGEVLVGAGEWNQSQLEIVAWSHIDYCDFNGPQFPGFIENNPIKLKIWDESELTEYEAFFTITEGSMNFQEISYVVIDEICDINNISENECDCNGNILDDCGICGGNGTDEDDDGICDDIDECIGQFDECGVCNGEGPMHQCWDGEIVCDPIECSSSNFPAPDLFTFNQSLSQAFYFINQVTIENINIENEDWLGAFNGDICVGSRKWDTNMCTNGICDIGVMGYDGSDATEGYMLNGQFPTFKLFDASENIYYDAIPSDNFPFVNGGLFVIDNINQSDYYCNNNPSCSGCIDINACNYDSSALIEDTCYYFESDLLQPFNNEVILLGDLPGGTMNFEWSNINQSCYEEELNYNIQIFDSNNQIIFSQLTQENNISISYSDLNINEGAINLYSWNILIDDIPLSDIFSFSIDATMMNVIDNKVDNFKIYQNYPNPFNPLTCIEFEIFSFDFIQINIYDVEGNLIDNLASNYYNPGNHKIYWNANSNSSGIYFYEISNSNNFIRKKMMFIK